MDIKIDGQSWMENLPKPKQACPIQQLIIPGTHDSCSFSVSTKQDISPAEPKWMKTLVRIFGKLAKSFIYKWSVTQELDLLQQLNEGSRYVDFRVALNPDDGKFRVVHGLYGATLTEVFLQVKTFTTAHPKEVVILDFNHFYNLDIKAHQKFATMIKGIFGNTLLPPGSKGVGMTLNDAWDTNKSVIVVYDNYDIVSASPSFWPGGDMYSPWANTTSTTTLINFLNAETEKHDLPKGSFHVAQGLLSPNTKTLLLHLTSTLKATLALKATQAVTTWLKGAQERNSDHTFNIVIADFVDYDQFLSTVISLNYK